MRFADRKDFLHGLAYVVFRRKWMILLCFMAAFLLVLFAGFLITPTWDAETYIEVGTSGRTATVPFAGVAVPSGSQLISPPENVALLLSGKRMAYDIVREFGLDERLRQRTQNPERFRDKAKMAVVRTLQLPWLLLQLVGVLDEPEIDWIDRAADDFRKGFSAQLDVEVVEGTNVVEIVIHGESQQLAMDIANSMTARIQDILADVTTRANEETALAYGRQLDVARGRLKVAEDALSSFLEENKTSGPSEMTIAIASELNSLNILLERLKSERYSLANQQTSLSSGRRIGEVPSSERIESNSVVEELRRSLNARLVRYAAQRQEKTELHPDVLALSNEIDELSARLSSELTNIIDGIDLDMDRLENEIEGLETRLMGMPAKDLEYARLLMQVQVFRELVLDLQTFVEQVDAITASGLADTNVRVLERAYVSPLADNDAPSMLIVLFVAILFGFGSAIGPAFFLEYWRDPIKGPMDLEKNGVRVLGMAPTVPELPE